MASQCTFISKTGDRCLSLASTKYGGDKCARHRSNVKRTKCIYPDCDRWTSSVTGQCTFHPRPSSTARRPSTSEPPVEAASPSVAAPTQGVQCNFIHHTGVHCFQIASHPTGRCTAHVGGPARRKCLMGDCTAVTYSKYGLCRNHIKTAKVEAVRKLAALVAEVPVNYVRRRYEETGYIPSILLRDDSDGSDNTSSGSSSNSSSGPSSPSAQVDNICNAISQMALFEASDPIPIPQYPHVPPCPPPQP